MNTGEFLMAIYTEPGRGRKQCPNCNMYVGVMSKSCDGCNHSFDGHTPQVKEIAVYDEPGRRRKQCPSCHVYLGYSVNTCPKCDHDFDRQGEDEKPPIEDEAPDDEPRGRYYPFGVLVHTPSGPCPYPLKGHDDETVIEWGNKLTTHYQNQGKEIVAEAMNYFARKVYYFQSDEFANVKRTIHDNFPAYRV